MGVERVGAVGQGTGGREGQGRGYQAGCGEEKMAEADDLLLEE